MRLKSWRRPAAVLVGAALLATACGDDDESGSGSSSDTTADAGTDSTTETSGTGADGGADVEAAQQLVDQYMDWTPASVLDVVPGPLSEAPPTGKRIYWMQCAVPVCKDIGDSVEEAAGVLGWEFRRIDMGQSPDQIQSAWNQAIQDPPDLIMGSGVDEVIIESQLQQLQEMGVPYIAGSVSDSPGGLNIGVVAPTADKEMMGELMAAWVVADTGGDAQIVYFDLSDFPVLVRKREAFQRRLEELCPDCSFEVQNVSGADIGRTVPGNVVSYLQANPDTDYVVFGTAGIATGVSQAVREAGFIGQVRGVTSAGNRTVWEEILSDDPFIVADIPNNDPFQGWQLIDRAARYFVGDETMGDGFHETDGQSTPYRWVTPETISDPNAPFAGPEDYRDQWREIWQLDG